MQSLTRWIIVVIGTFPRGGYLDVFQVYMCLRRHLVWRGLGEVVSGRSSEALAEVGVCGDKQLVKPGYSLHKARELE
jgi:hypothetical protein